MTTGEMLGYTKRLDDITSSNVSKDIVGQRLSNLKSDIEEAFEVHQTSYPVALTFLAVVENAILERG